MTESFVERCTQESRQVLFCARYEAACIGSTTIQGHHLLLGLLREHNKIPAPRLREALEAADKEIRAEIITSVGLEDASTGVDLPLSEEGKRILNASAEEAAKLGGYAIGPEHLVLGILREEGCLAAGVLRNIKVDLNQARSMLS